VPFLNEDNTVLIMTTNKRFRYHIHPNRTRSFATIVLTVVVAAISCVSAKAADLEAGFRNPPVAARPYTWWHWMNGNITREGITTDLEAMARVGIGGVQIFNIAGSHGCDIPAGPVDYLSDEWLDLVRYAANQAKRHGMELCLHNCAGWATSGGPWIEPQNASQILVFAELKVTGGRTIEQKLPLPQRMENVQKEPQLEMKDYFYRDIAVFAFPTPLNDQARLSRWTTAALYRTCRTGRQPSLQPTSTDGAIDPKTILQISKYMQKDGTLVWKAPPGEWTILRLGHTTSGKINSPAPESGRGLEIDKLSRPGIDSHWKDGIDPILKHLGPLAGDVLSTIHIDSYEGGFANWTPNFQQEFIARRGYDPMPYLIAMTGRIVGNGPKTERFLWDIRRTVADLYADHYYGYFAKQCHNRGLTYSIEPYRGPFESMKIASHADIPMGEFWTDKIYVGSLKLASSAAHLHNRTLASAEAFTAGPPNGRWQNHPGSLKRMGDLAWTRGINRFVFHRFAHQPWTNQVPGMTMGVYGAHIDRTNTWWEQGHAWMKYIARSQFLLQQGDFVGDVLCFVGEASPIVGIIRKDIKDAGYDYDLCGTDTIDNLKVVDGDIVLPSGRRYRLLVLPSTTFQTPALARKIRSLVRDGASVLGPKPQYTPSLADFPNSEKEVIAIGEEVWGDCDGVKATSGRFGKGRVFTGISPAEALTHLQVDQDVHLPDNLKWIHRRTDNADIYFISNQSDEAIDTVAGFRVTGKVPELWNAEQNTIRHAAGWTVKGNHVYAPLNLPPEKSIFVVFRQRGRPQSDPFIKVETPEPQSWAAALDSNKDTLLSTWDNGPHTLHRASGKTSKIEVSGVPDSLPLSGPWHVRFQPKRGAPARARFDRLASWTEHKDRGIRYFSGTATSTIEFDLPDDFLAQSEEVWLDLGRVAVIAEVRLNGKNFGVLWHAPFRTDVSEALRPGRNTLEVDVTNLWINRLIGDEQLPDDCQWTESYLSDWPEWLTEGKPRPQSSRVTFTTWKHWSADDPLRPSGLIGPVTLRPARLIPISTRTATSIGSEKPTKAKNCVNE